MIEMNCPACGAGGRVPRDKVGTRLVCKKCLKVFHLTPSGQAVLGEPPAPKVAAKEKSSKDPTGYQTTEALEELASKMAKIKLPSRQNLASWLDRAGGRIGLLVVFPPVAREPAPAKSLKPSSAAEIKKIVDISVPGTETDVILWFNDVYQQYCA